MWERKCEEIRANTDVPWPWSSACISVKVVLGSYLLFTLCLCSVWVSIFLLRSRPWRLAKVPHVFLIIFATLVTGTSSCLKRVLKPFTFSMLDYNVLSDPLRKLSSLLSLVHVQCCAHDDTKLQSDYFSLFKKAEWLVPRLNWPTYDDANYRKHFEIFYIITIFQLFILFSKVTNKSLFTERNEALFQWTVRVRANLCTSVCTVICTIWNTSTS